MRIIHAAAVLSVMLGCGAVEDCSVVDVDRGVVRGCDEVRLCADSRGSKVLFESTEASIVSLFVISYAQMRVDHSRERFPELWSNVLNDGVPRTDRVHPIYCRLYRSGELVLSRSFTSGHPRAINWDLQLCTSKDGRREREIDGGVFVHTGELTDRQDAVLQAQFAWRPGTRWRAGNQ